MEQLNKNPVTDTFVDLSVVPARVCYRFLEHLRQHVDQGHRPGNTRTRDPLVGLAGPPIGLDMTGQGNDSTGKPNPAPLANANPQVGSLSNFRSDHPDGGLFLLCDGSVQFLSENIDMSIYTGLSTIQGGETVSGAVGEP